MLSLEPALHLNGFIRRRIEADRVERRKRQIDLQGIYSVEWNSRAGDQPHPTGPL